jgi:hypothetical protein
LQALSANRSPRRQTAVLAGVAMLVTLVLVAAPVASGQGEYERLFSRAASKVAENRVEVYCWYDRQEWNASFGSDIAGSYSPDRNVIDLSPTTCVNLRRAVYDHWRPTGFRAKSRLSDALETLAHEGEHAFGVSNEKKADCYAMQDMELAADTLPLGWRLGRSLARFYWNNIYPNTRYWSAKCHDGGPWDIYDESIWP